MRLFVIILTGLFMGLAAYSILQTLSTNDEKAAWIMFAVFCVAVMCAIAAAVMGAVRC